MTETKDKSHDANLKFIRLQDWVVWMLLQGATCPACKSEHLGYHKPTCQLVHDNYDAFVRAEAKTAEEAKMFEEENKAKREQRISDRVGMIAGRMRRKNQVIKKTYTARVRMGNPSD